VDRALVVLRRRRNPNWTSELRGAATTADALARALDLSDAEL